MMFLMVMRCHHQCGLMVQKNNFGGCMRSRGGNQGHLPSPATTSPKKLVVNCCTTSFKFSIKKTLDAQGRNDVHAFLDHLPVTPT
jgi:hypothetical protein